MTSVVNDQRSVLSEAGGADGQTLYDRLILAGVSYCLGDGVYGKTSDAPDGLNVYQINAISVSSDTAVIFQC